jgi:hypothetical protein
MSKRPEHRYMLGDTYTIVDMAVWGWARAVPFVLGAEAWGPLPHVKRLLDEINARPAAQRAMFTQDGRLEGADFERNRHIVLTESASSAIKSRVTFWRLAVACSLWTGWLIF